MSSYRLKYPQKRISQIFVTFLSNQANKYKFNSSNDMENGIRSRYDKSEENEDEDEDKSELVDLDEQESDDD